MKRFLALFLALLFLGSSFANGEIHMNYIKYVSSKEIPDTPALQFTRKLGAGWNLGNTLDATNDYHKGSDTLSIETAWGNPKTNREMIKAIKDAGFSTIRLPVSWHNHVNEAFVINEPWMNRVQELVDIALELDLYVILNTHHDVDPRFYYPSSQHAETSLRYITTVWTQIATRFSDYDDRLIFEGMNEPRLTNTSYEWSLQPSVPECKDALLCLDNLNQAFVDAVRKTGGKNATRYLMVTPYSAAPTNLDYFNLPKDTIADHLIVSIHAYTPYSFALEIKGTSEFTVQQTSDIVLFMNQLYNRYIANGTPVVLGEYGALNKQDNLQARIDFTSFYVASAAGRGIPCCWWDNGAFKGNGELFGLLNRRDCTFTYPEIVEAIMLNRIK